MEVVTSFHCIFCFSWIFATFPYTTSKSKTGHVITLSRRILNRGKIFLVLSILIRVATLTLDFRTIVLGYKQIAPTLFRAFNTCILNGMLVTIYAGMLRRGGDVCHWLNRINKLFLSINADCQSLANFESVMVIFSVTFFFTTNGCICYQLWTSGKFISGWIAIFDSVAFELLLLVENLHLCKFLIFTNIARFGFSRVNDILAKELLVENAKNNLVEKLHALRLQHLEMMDFHDFLNLHFGLNLLLYISWSFLSILFCSMSFVLFELDNMTLLIWTIYQPFQIIPLLYLCDAVAVEAKKTANHLHAMFIDCQKEEIKEEVELFSLQLFHRTADFNVHGFYNLDFALLHSMTSAITTYIVALSQFTNS